MKMKLKYAWAIVAAVPFAFQLFTVSAQSITKDLPAKEKKHILLADSATTAPGTLSGINLKPTKKGTFELTFEQVLTENAMLQVTNKAGKKVYTKPVTIANKAKIWNYNLGKLRPDTYKVEVITPDTTYWTKFKVGK